HMAAETPPWAAQQYAQLLDSYTPAAVTHRTLLAVAVDTRRLRSGGSLRSRGLAASLIELGQEMAGLQTSLRSAGLTVESWLPPERLAAVVRNAYASDAARLLEGAGGIAGRLGSAGPLAVTEHWSYLRHDSGYSTVMWVSEWPRVDVPAHFLHGVVFIPGVRKTLSITAAPLSTATAMRDIRKAKVAHLIDATERAKIGAIADLSDNAAYDDVLEREQALVAGHADYRFTGLVTITADALVELSDAVAAVTRAAVGCGCETRVLFGQQARAFTAAALPLARRVS
ncbi:MAG: SCO6880 family protein, partial [Streptosporangiaceae bacterium]